MRSIVLLFGVAVLSAACFLTVSPQAQAQGQCRAIVVEAIRAPRVDLYNLQGTWESQVPREELGAVTSATECPPNTTFLMVETPQGRKLVRRVALQLPNTVELPECPRGANGQYASQDTRNASSSGLGGASCRRIETPN